MLLTLETQLYAPARDHHPEWRPTVREVIETSTRREAVEKRKGLTLLEAADRLTLEDLKTLAHDTRLVVCG